MRHTPEVIHQFLAEQRVSGQTVAEFCAERGLKVPTFYSWRRKYSQPEPESPSGFFQLAPQSVSGECTLRLPGGLAIELSGLAASEIAILIFEIDRAYA